MTEFAKDREAEGNADTKTSRLFFLAAEVWMALVIGAFFVLRILDSHLFRTTYTRIKGH